MSHHNTNKCIIFVTSPMSHDYCIEQVSHEYSVSWNLKQTILTQSHRAAAVEQNKRLPTGDYTSHIPTTECLRRCIIYDWSVKNLITPIRLHHTNIGVNRPAFGGTVPHYHQMSRGPAKSADVPHFSKMVLLFFSLPIILHVCLATQQSDELRIKIGKDRLKIRTPTGH